MAIIIDQEQKLITLHTKNTTYQMGVGNYGQLLHLYYGKRLTGDMRYLLTYYDRGFSGNPYEAECDKTYSMDALPQEYPCFGNGDFRSPAFVQKNADGSYCADLRYVSCEVCKGKYQIPGLPAAYDETGAESETLKVYLEDAPGGVRVTLLYGVFAELDIITRAVQITNCGTEAVHVEKAASAALDFMTGEFDVIHFHGRHGMERIFERTPVEHANQVFGSRRGASGHQQNPFVMLAGKQTGEDAGECYGCMLLYSGNFKAEAEKDQYEQTRLVMGLSDEMFSWKLEPGETFDTPETAFSYSANGFSTLSWNLHRLIRSHICRSAYRDTKRPVLINNWEATYFNFTEEKLLQLASRAQKCGIELFVLDDGWFGARSSSKAGLGDWEANRDRLPNGLSGLAQKIEALGMKFGLWIEPEMVNADSDLFRTHPDWILQVPGRTPCHGRYQYILDFSRQEILDYIYEKIASILEGASISYIKWDMNRSLSDVWSRGVSARQQGEVFHRYILGVYQMYERLTTRFPDILFESCASGGARFDAGMLYYAPQGWLSDNTDAIERLRIQYGTSYGYPISSMGSHVSASPNHQLHRQTPLWTRANTAFFGTFGYELDLAQLGEDELSELKIQTAFMKQHRSLIQYGTFYRLSSPFENNITAWMVVSEDRTEALVGWYRTLNVANGPFTRLYLQGLEESDLYNVTEYTEGHESAVSTHYGDELMNLGLITSDASSGQYMDGRRESCDFDSRLFYVQKQAE